MNTALFKVPIGFLATTNLPSTTLIIGLIAQFVWAINSIQLKTYKKWFPEAYSNNSIVFWRSLPIWILGYYFCKYKNIQITHIIAASKPNLDKYNFHIF